MLTSDYIIAWASLLDLDGKQVPRVLLAFGHVFGWRRIGLPLNNGEIGGLTFGFSDARSRVGLLRLSRCRCRVAGAGRATARR